ncbi:hypothetical protein HNP38_002290 [Chryseobacterium defluvii]|uniref:Uncharacterized protein n=1 Tax=Chryseobacterium defluvii TaxID=160396 RepID=A0A840KH18_9FLAO|nr:hypothetical protein [Chryseobacterium defluvii]
MLNSFVPLTNDSELNIEDMLVHNLNGIINAKTKQNIDDVILYDSISFMILLILIIETHKLHFLKLDYKNYYLTILSAYNWELLKYRRTQNYVKKPSFK